MANVYANFSLDMSDLDLNRILRGAHGTRFFDDYPVTLDGVTYQDTYEAYWWYRTTDYASCFMGDDLDATESEILGGVATAYYEFIWDYCDATSRYYWGITDISVPAEELFDAAGTGTVDDDMTILREALSGDDSLLLSPFNDIAYGYDGQDVLRGFDGRDVLKGGRGKDTLRGGDDADRLFGERGNDRLFGGAGDDTLKGGGGADVLFGKNGSDRLIGGRGNDVMTGGDGKDTFVFRAGDGVDVICDFQWDPDKLLLDDALWSGTLTASQVVDAFGLVDTRGVVLDFGDDEIVLQGFTGSDVLLLGNLESEIGII